MGDGWGPARVNAHRHETKMHRRPRQALGSTALAIVAAICATAAPALSQWLQESLQLHLVQGIGKEALQIVLAPTIAASPAAQSPLTIGIGPPGALPNNSFVRVRGLPPTVSLSDGYAIAPGSWSV